MTFWSGAARRRWIPACAVTLVALSLILQTVGASPWDGALWAFGVPLLVTTFPDGRFVPRWTEVVVLAWLALATVYVITDGSVISTWWWTALGFSQALLLVPAIHRYRRRLSTDERERVRWGLLGLLLGSAGMLALVATAFARGGTINDLGIPGQVAATIFTLLYPLGFALGFLKPRALDVDVLLRNSLLATGTGLALGVTYGAVLALLVPLGASGSAAGWCGAAAVGLTAVPLTRTFRRIADWVVYRNAPDANEALRDLGERLDAQAESERIPETVLELLSDTLGCESASLSAQGLPDARLGDPSGLVERSVTYQGVVIATVRVSPRAGESALTRRDALVLATVLQHAAPAIHGAQALAELADARSRIVRAREEELKSLRRDLHDDLAPTLAGLGLTAAGIAELARGNDDGLSPIIDDLLADIRSAISQTRSIAYGLRPSVLDDHGLAAAVRDRTRASADLSVEVVAPADRLVLPAAVELAALRIVQEAVLNVRKHAGARHCRIDLEVTSGTFEVRVTDDGCGMPARPRLGIGMNSIRARAAELGGRAWFSSVDAGGTRVRVVLPTLAVAP